MTRTSLDQRLASVLHQKKLQSQYRRRKVLSSPQGTRVILDGKHCTSFCSNDYLGLANHPEVKKSFISAVERFGVGSGASHLVAGHSLEHHELEVELAEFFGRPRCLLFSSGYMANLGVLSALVSRSDLVLQDKLNHASLIDAALLSHARFKRYPHADTLAAERVLRKFGHGHKWLLSDGVFSMDGDIAPLNELATLAADCDATLIIDDAHGLGCLGENGRGSTEALGLSHDQTPILIGTLGKAFGTSGAFVLGSEALVETLIQSARTYIYTTALPSAVAAATRRSLRLLSEETWRREKLHSLIAYFRAGCEAAGIDVMPSQSAIQPIIVGDDERCLALSRSLLEKGFFVSAIRPPTVPQGTARLRITLSADHQECELSRLIDALGVLVNSTPGENRPLST